MIFSDYHSIWPLAKILSNKSQKYKEHSKFLSDSPSLGIVPKFHSDIKQVQVHFPHEIIIRLQFSYVNLKLMM